MPEVLAPDTFWIPVPDGALDSGEFSFRGHRRHLIVRPLPDDAEVLAVGSVSARGRLRLAAGVLWRADTRSEAVADAISTVPCLGRALAAGIAVRPVEPGPPGLRETWERPQMLLPLEAL